MTEFYMWHAKVKTLTFILQTKFTLCNTKFELQTYFTGAEGLNTDVYFNTLEK